MSNKRVSLLPILLLFLVVFTLGGANASGPWKKEHGEESIHLIIEAVDLIFVAEVSTVTYECDSRDRGIAYLTVNNVDCWWGEYPEGFRVRVPRVDLSACEGKADETRPNPIEVGTRYLFFCDREFSQSPLQYLDQLFVSVHGMLCLNEDREIGYCGGGYSFTFDNPGQRFREALQAISLERMTEDSDLVVVAQRFAIPGKTGPFSLAQVAKSTECPIEFVIKGEFEGSTLKFNPLSKVAGNKWMYRALISSTDRAVLFLKRSGDEYGLICGSKSYFPLGEGNQIFSGCRLPMGAVLSGKHIEKTSQKTAIGQSE